MAEKRKKTFSWSLTYKVKMSIPYCNNGKSETTAGYREGVTPLVFVLTRVSPRYTWVPATLNENSRGKLLPHFKDFQCNLIGTEPIFTDFSANSAPILVEYSYLHVPCTPGCFVWIWCYLVQNWPNLSLANKHTYNIQQIIVRWPNHQQQKTYCLLS